jgi:uncharacterized membrane protein YgdD (TMEM256/DUF423 family)
VSGWRAAGIAGALAVLLGAFGAHGLEARVADPELLAIWETAARYHLAHALALGLVAAHPARPRAAGVAFIVGITIFSGSLYLLVLTGARWLGAITPVGGLSLIAGWVLLALAGRGVRT